MMEFFLFIPPSHLNVCGDGFGYFMYCFHPIVSESSCSLAHVKSAVINDKTLLIPTGSDLI